MTPEKLTQFSNELLALLDKYIDGETTTERIVQDAAICNVLSDCSEAGFQTCSRVIREEGLNGVAISAEIGDTYRAHKRLFAEAREQRAAAQREQINKTLNSLGFKIVQ